MVPSSRGLGRGPLKAATRVRIPLGSPFQTAASKMAAFSLFFKRLTEFECSFFKFLVLGEFYELA